MKMLPVERLILSTEDNWDEETYDIEYDNFISDFNQLCKENKFVIYGSIQRWDGVSHCGDVIRCAEDIWVYLKDCDVYKIYDENGHLFVSGAHPDGNVYFEIRQLNKKGEKYLEKHEYDLNYKSFMSLVKSKSICPHFVHKMWGCPKTEYRKEV